MKTRRDPIAVVYDAIWAAIEKDKQLCAMVDYRRRTQWTDPDRAAEASPADDTPERPQLSLEWTGGTLSPWASNTSATMVMQFNLTLSTRKSQIDADLTPITWSILRALANTPDDLGVAWVTLVTLGEATVSGKIVDEGSSGWIIQVPIIVAAAFEKTDLATAEHQMETQP